MQATARRSWRSEPRYDGHCADGWYQGLDGRFHFRPPDADVDQARKRLALLLDGLPAAAAPSIRPVAAYGTLPSDSEVDVMRRELAKLPPNVAEELNGWQIEIVSGADARRHPDTGLSLVRVQCSGWCSWRRKLIAVAVSGPLV